MRFDIPPEEDDQKVELPTRNEGILILQRNERARQSRQRATFMKQLRCDPSHCVINSHNIAITPPLSSLFTLSLRHINMLCCAENRRRWP